MPRVARVLAVDDDPEVLGTLAEFLRLNGYEVTTAGNGGDAVMLVSGVSPDVVLLDITMPRVDGMAALRRIRASHPDLPVIMLTGNSDVAIARDALKLGAFDYVAKPFDFPHLARVIEVALTHGAQAGLD